MRRMVYGILSNILLMALAKPIHGVNLSLGLNLAVGEAVTLPAGRVKQASVKLREILLRNRNRFVRVLI